MCSRYELSATYNELTSALKANLPKGFKDNYKKQLVLEPSNPVLVLKNEGKITSSIMLWGYISEWSKNPLNGPKPFNARAETVGEKKLFRTSWRYKRCLIPATGFIEKGYLIKRIDSKPFLMGGIWSRWTGKEGSEIESCAVITTKSNNLLKPIHNRMPVIIPEGSEEEWMSNQKDKFALKALEALLDGWSSEKWLTIPLFKFKTSQLSLF